MRRFTRFRSALGVLILAAAVAVGPATAAGKSAESAQKRIATGSENYVASPVVAAPITLGRSVSGLLQVDCGFDIPNAKLRARVEALQPRIRAEMRDALAYYARSFYRPQTVPDATRIAAVLQAAADRSIGEPGARLVLVSVMVHDRQ